jgi:hypothetical protein
MPHDSTRKGDAAVVRRSSIVLVLAAAVGLLTATAGWTLSNPFPKPPRRLTIQGELTGKLRQGGTVQFDIVATDPSGWTDLSTVKLTLLLHGQPIQDVAFVVEGATLSTTGQPPVHFPGPESLQGSFLEIFHDSSDKTPGLVKQTFRINLHLSAKIREAIPGATVVRVVATSDGGDVTYARVKAGVSSGLLSWGTFAVAAAVALFIGGFIGNTFTHRRYRQREPSIWDIVERRLREQKARPPAPVLAGSDGGAA